jgi:hypothetical protein
MPALAVAAESVGYGVVTARSLFAAALAVLDGLSEETKAVIRTRLLNVDGVIEFDDLLKTSSADVVDPPEEAIEEPEPSAAADPVTAEG